MADEIINRVANSKLITFDLEELYPKGTRTVIDIKEWLYEGLLLREKEFRASIASHDWSSYKGHYIALSCSTDAIIPAWAYLLLTSALEPFAKKVVVGDVTLLETLLYQEIIEAIETSAYQDKPVIIKGCANKPVPEGAYIALLQKLQPVAKSLMYGEACSSVPLYKRK